MSLDLPPAPTAGRSTAGLSTSPEERDAPGAAPPRRSAARRTPAAARRAWRRLTSMRTALLLLFLLALAAVPGSLLPQRGLNPFRVKDYYAAHPALAPALDRLGLFDVFAAPWFAAIYLLLFVSLIGCLVPRIRLHARALASPPPPVPARLDRLPAADGWTLPAGADRAAAAEAVRVTLRRRGWRVCVRPEPDGSLGVAAEKGYLRETGNLVFHVALVGLLLAIAAGGLFGYKGTVLLVQGEGFANSPTQYDVFTPGRAFSAGRMAPFTVTLERFTATYQADAQPRDFHATVTVSDRPGAPTRQTDLQVNHPVSVDGARVYLISHGYAVHVVVRGGDGRVAYDGAVPCLTDPAREAVLQGNCAVAVPDARPDQLGFQGFFTPTTVAGPDGLTSVSPELRNPALTLLAYRGDLGLDAGIPKSVYRLDTTHLTSIESRSLVPGQAWALPGGGSLQFVEAVPWVTLQTTVDPGRTWALVTAVLVIAGLLASLRVRRRRLWVRVSGPAGGTGAGGPTLVTMGGLARTDADRYAQEFAALAGSLRRRLAPHPHPAPPASRGPTGPTAGQE